MKKKLLQSKHPFLSHSRPRLFDVPLDPIPESKLIESIAQLADSHGLHHVITCNPLMVLDSLKDNHFHSILNKSSLNLPESSGIRWALRLFQHRGLEPIAGIDLAMSLCVWAAQHHYPVFLLGGSTSSVEQAAQNLKKNVPDLIFGGVEHGFFDNPRPILQKIRSSHSKLILIGMGSPRQEKWIDQFRDQLPPGIYMGVGGTFDVWSGHLKRSPEWMRKIGCEWLFRLLQEPWRWKRMVRLPAFGWLVLKEKYFSTN